MLPKKELQALASAIRATPEYAQVISLRRKLLGNPQLGVHMQNFEREHTRILSAGVPEEEISSRLKKLYADHQSFLDHEEVRNYVQATQAYHQMVSTGMQYLNELLDISRVR